jgi:hypothetical protein
MKKILTAALIILSFSSSAQKMIKIEIIQDLTSSHIANGYSLLDKKFDLYSTGASISYMANPFGDHFYFEPFFAFTFLPDSSKLASKSHRSSLNPEIIPSSNNGSTMVEQYSIGAPGKTNHFSAGFNLMKKVNSYFWIGGGIHAVMSRTFITDNVITDAFVYEDDLYSLVYRSETPIGFQSNKTYLTVPIIIRASLPVKENFVFLSLIGHLSVHARMQASIGFSF